MRLAYLGTSPFAAAVLERLVAGGHAPELVVTRPDRPKGRGRRLASPPVADTARGLGLEVHQPERASSDERLVGGGFDHVVVCAYGALIHDPLLSTYDILNVHPSLLPRWRGAAPVERAIMAGDERTGVAIMRLVEGLDEGPVCLMAPEPIRPDDDFATLSARLVDIGAALLARALDEAPPCAPQAHEGVTYAEKIGAGDRTLDPARPAAELDRVVRALHPHVGARAALPDGSFLGVHRATACAGAAPGAGLRVEDGALLLGCADGALELLEVQPAGGRAMEGQAWARGHGDALRPGDARR